LNAAAAQAGRAPECRFKADEVVLSFDAKGRLACNGEVPALAEGAKIKACVRTAAQLAHKYRLYFTFAKPSDEGLAVRAPGGGAAPSPAEAAGIVIEDNPCAVATAVTSQVTVHVETSGIEGVDDVSVATELAVVTRYNVNIGLLGGISKATQSFTVTEGKVASLSNDAPLVFYLTFHFYPLSGFSRYFGDGSRLYGDPVRDRFSLFAGIDLPDPTKSLAVGLSAEVVPGVMLAGAWAPRRVGTPSGFSVGDTITGDSVPLKMSWDLKSWIVGVAVDASVAKAILAHF